jgi:hypothetical protein
MCGDAIGQNAARRASLTRERGATQHGERVSRESAALHAERLERVASESRGTLWRAAFVGVDR